MQLLIKTPEKGWALLPDNQLTRPYLHSILSEVIFWNGINPRLPHAETLQHTWGTEMDFRLSFPDNNKYDGKAEFGFYYYLDLINITVKAAWKLGLSSETIVSVLEKYVPEPMRAEIWKSETGTTFINETYCSDPLSIDQALESQRVR